MNWRRKSWPHKTNNMEGKIIKFKIRAKGYKAYFNVLVFEKKQEMWDWYADYRFNHGQPADYNFGAIVIPYEIVRTGIDGKEERKNDIGTVLFHKGLVGGGVVAHEMGHCAMWYDRLINENKNAEYGPEIGDAEERMLYALADLTRAVTDKFWQLGVY